MDTPNKEPGDRKDKNTDDQSRIAESLERTGSRHIGREGRGDEDSNDEQSQHRDADGRATARALPAEFRQLAHRRAGSGEVHVRHNRVSKVSGVVPAGCGVG